MCETMQSSHRLRPVMALVRALLAPTASGDDAGERFCAPLRLRLTFPEHVKKDLTNFFFFLRKFALLGGGTQSRRH